MGKISVKYRGVNIRIHGAEHCLSLALIAQYAKPLITPSLPSVRILSYEGPSLLK